ncbi:sugar transferase [Alphaproteobacteria bacterium]|nr:sugar transferase [Alphaproteobacteria bacterium]
MKRLFDLITILLLLPFMLLVCLIIALLIKITFGSPILFKQLRPGLNGKFFIMFKFRTMTNELGLDGNLLPDNKRLTGFGKFLRSISLDELPELYNVIKGDMSLVGPRPLLIEYLPLYNNKEARRHEVLPGITGWAQVNGRNLITWNKKFDLDVWYVDNQSLWLDIKILWLTLKKVFSRDGINKSKDVTMDKFKGGL